MRLERPRRGADVPPHDLAAALRRAADAWGHRPAITVLRRDRREEQGFASLAQWAAKGAHLLTLDLLVEPGDRLALVGPPGWMPAAVSLAAWWAGAVVVPAGPAAVAVVHEQAPVPDGVAEVLRWGDAVDGTPVTDGMDEPWAIAVQAFPDAPPPSRASAALPALGTTRALLDHAGVLAAATAGTAADGVAGFVVRPDLDPAAWLPTVAVRPLVTGRPTVVLDGVGPGAADAERVTTWSAPTSA